MVNEHTAPVEGLVEPLTNRELAILADKSISAYFLIVWDFVNEARRRGIPANARGSGVGTMVGYCLGLSNACPVRYGLLFERFTDPDRSEYPDIDIDLCQDGRAEIIEYVRSKYDARGEGTVAQIITFNVLKAKAAIRDVGRVMNVPLSQVDTVTKLVGDQLNITLDEALAANPDLRGLYDGDEDTRSWIDTARRLEGLTRHAGVHAAGVVIGNQALSNILPLAVNRQGDQEILITQWDGPTCEKIGLLKMDFLGLRTLSIIERARQLVRADLDPEVIRRTVDPEGERPASWDPLDLERLSYDDPRVLDLFRRGETVSVFQFESDGMRRLLCAMGPDRIEDLIAANALFRPGPMALIDDYNARKHGRQGIADRGDALVQQLDPEIGARAVHVRRQQGDLEPAQLLAELVQLVGIAQVVGHGGGHELDGMVGLEVGGLDRDQGVGRGVTLVEAVAGELVDLLEDLRCLGLRHAARRGALDEVLALGLHLGLDLLAHGPAQQIGAAQAVAGQFLGDLHDLFLIDHDAEGLLQDAFEGRIEVVRRLAVLAGDVAGDIVHRAGAVERHHGDDVLEAIGLQAAQHVAHSR